MAAVSGIGEPPVGTAEDAFVSLALFTILGAFSADEGPEFFAVMRPTVDNRCPQAGWLEEGSG
jgi:hypothetical protein